MPCVCVFGFCSSLVSTPPVIVLCLHCVHLFCLVLISLSISYMHNYIVVVPLTRCNVIFCYLSPSLVYLVQVPVSYLVFLVLTCARVTIADYGYVYDYSDLLTIQCAKCKTLWRNDSMCSSGGVKKWHLFLLLMLPMTPTKMLSL